MAHVVDFDRSLFLAQIEDDAISTGTTGQVTCQLSLQSLADTRALGDLFDLRPGGRSSLTRASRLCYTHGRTASHFRVSFTKCSHARDEFTDPGTGSPDQALGGSPAARCRIGAGTSRCFAGRSAPVRSREAASTAGLCFPARGARRSRPMRDSLELTQVPRTGFVAEHGGAHPRGADRVSRRGHEAGALPTRRRGGQPPPDRKPRPGRRATSSSSSEQATAT